MKPCLPLHAPTLLGPNPHAPLQELNITIKKKLHFPRMFGARQLDEQGVSQDVSDCCHWGVPRPTGCCAYLTLRAHPCGVLLQIIARLGRWQRTALNSSYLKFFRPEGLLAAGGWPGGAQAKFDQFFADRLCVTVSGSGRMS